MEDKFFNNDVFYMKSLIGKTVKVETVDKSEHIGAVFVVDPIYKTLVIINKTTNCVDFILYHAIKSMEVLPDATREDFLKTTCSNNTTQDLTQKKLLLTKWLQHMFLEVKEEGESLKVEEHLVIEPPYGKNDCICDNTIVLERIRNIIDLMPPDFE